MKRILIIAFLLISQLGFSQNYNYFWNYPAFSSTIFTLNSVTPSKETCSFVASTTIISDGALDITERGIVYSNSTNPTTSDTKIVNGSGVGEYLTTATSVLTNGVKYIRAYIINSFGTFYSNEISYSPYLSFTISTVTVDYVTDNTIFFHGTVVKNGDNISFIVINYGTSFLNNSIAVYLETDGSWSSKITGLNSSTLYYFEAHRNMCGLDYIGAGRVQSTTTSAPVTGCPDTAILYESGVSSTAFTIYASITDDGGSAVTERGVVIGTTPHPTISSNTQKVTSGIGIGNYNCYFSGLSSGVKYYAIAYSRTATCDPDYGQQLEVTTLSACVPATISTTTPSSITSSSVVVGGNATADGGCTIIEKGVVISGSSSVSYYNYVNKADYWNGTGSFSTSFGMLSASNLYYVKAYAVTVINGVTTIAYGSLLNFTTNATSHLPIVSTTNVSAITGVSAASGGSVSSDGGATVSARGIVWDTFPNQPTIVSGQYDGITSNGTGTGSFTSAITSLTAGVTYTYRAYATNSVGTAYGYVNYFTTLNYPVVNTSAAANISATSATVTATIYAGNPVSDFGVCWSTSTNPTIAGSHTNAGSCTCAYPYNYTINNITGLTGNTLYYVRSWATNSVGTAYGNEITFTTINPTLLPTVTISAATNISASTVTGHGEVTSIGSSPVTQRGICWTTSPTTDPTISDSRTVDGSGLGVFTSSIVSLLGSTTYYARTYAINTSGTAYSPTKISFTTDFPSFFANGSDVAYVGTGGANPTATANIGSGTNLYVLAIVSTYGNRVVSAPTLNGVALTQAGSLNGSSPVEIWYMINPPIGSFTVAVPNTLYNLVEFGGSCYKSNGTISFYSIGSTSTATSNTSTASVSVPIGFKSLIIQNVSISDYLSQTIGFSGRSGTDISSGGYLAGWSWQYEILTPSSSPRSEYVTFTNTFVPTSVAVCFKAQ